MAKKFFALQPNDEVAVSADLSNLTPASIDLVSWQDLTIQDGEESIADKIANDDAHIKSDGVASTFAEATYAAGDFCTYDGKAYVCKLGYTATAASPDPGNDTTHWQLANLITLFSSDNTSLMGVLPYTRNSTATLKDRAFNALTLDGTSTWNLSTDLAAVTATKSGEPRDLLITVMASAAVTIAVTSGTIKGDTPTISAAGTWLFAFTEYASGVWYCRQISLA